jgi:plasmid stabilization system protein ParE
MRNVGTDPLFLPAMVPVPPIPVPSVPNISFISLPRSSTNPAIHQAQERCRNRRQVEQVIFDKIVFLAGSSGAGRLRENLTDEAVKFFPVYSYLIVYRADRKPLQIVAILHGSRDVEQILKDRTKNSGYEY